MENWPGSKPVPSEQLGAIAERTGAQRDVLRGKRAPLEEAVTDFKTKLDALPEDVRQATVQIHATHRDATTELAGSKANSLKTADEVKTAGRKLRATKKHRTTPRTPGRGKPDSYEQLHTDLVSLAGQDVDPIIRQQINAYGNGVAASFAHEADEKKMQAFLTDLRSGKLTPTMETVANDGYVTVVDRPDHRP